MLNRREVLAICGMGVVALTSFEWFPGQVFASPQDVKKRMAELAGGAKPKKGRVTITLPKITDQGNFVPVSVAVESRMTQEEHVKAIHILAERNPVPEVVSFFLGPQNPKAVVSTRIRLVKTQVVIALAEISDGSLYIGKARCKILTGVGGCG